MSDSKPFGIPARIMHWGMAVLIVALFMIAWNMEDAPKGSDERKAMFALHRELGVLAGMLLVIRLLMVWKSNWYPQPLGDAKQQMITKLSHLALYLAIFGMAFSGSMMTLFGGHDIDFFGLFTIPGFTESDFIHDMGELVHELGQYAMMALVGLHVLAALAHHFVMKDETLNRMTKG